MNDMIIRRTPQKTASHRAARQIVSSDRRADEASAAKYVPIVR